MVLFILRIRIEYLRFKLNRIKRISAAPDKKVLALSKKLDKLILRYQNNIYERFKNKEPDYYIHLR